MSELVKKITSTYNDMSESKKYYSYSYLEGYRQCVVDIQESEQKLNEDQKIVLGWLKKIYRDEDVSFTIVETIAYLDYKYNNYFLEEDVRKSYELLNEKHMVQVIQAFTDWWLIK